MATASLAYAEWRCCAVTTRWSFFVDESGNFGDPDDIVAVSGVLLHHRSSLQPHVLKAALRRVVPVLPWPPHAWLLNQPAFTAMAIRETMNSGALASSALTSAALEAWRVMKKADSEAADTLLQALRSGDVDEAKAEIKLLTTAIRNADNVSFNILRHYGIEIRALIARLLTEAANLKRVADESAPVWLLLASETVAGDAVPSTSSGSDRYLELLQILLGRLSRALGRAGGEHEVAIWVSRRNVANADGGTEHLHLPRLQSLITLAGEHEPSVRLIAAGIGRSTDERGAGYVLADFGANASRIAVFPRTRTLDEVYSVLRERFGSVQIATRKVYSHCAASGDAAALIKRAESERIEAPRRELPANHPKAYWACQQAWTWVEAVSK